MKISDFVHRSWSSGSGGNEFSASLWAEFSASLWREFSSLLVANCCELLVLFEKTYSALSFRSGSVVEELALSVSISSSKGLTDSLLVFRAPSDLWAGCEPASALLSLSESESEDEIASMLYVLDPLPSSLTTGDTRTLRCCSRRGCWTVKF